MCAWLSPLAPSDLYPSTTYSCIACGLHTQGASLTQITVEQCSLELRRFGPCIYVIHMLPYERAFPYVLFKTETRLSNSPFTFMYFKYVSIAHKTFSSPRCFCWFLFLEWKLHKST